MLAKYYTTKYITLFQLLKGMWNNKPLQEVPKFVKIVWEKVYTFLFPATKPYKKCNYRASLGPTWMYIHISYEISST